MRRALGLSLALAGMTCLIGCVMPDQVTQLQKDMTDVQRRLQGIEQEQIATRDQLGAIEGELAQGDGITRAEFADVALQLDEISRNVAILDERLNDAGRRMDRMSQTMEEVRELARRRSVGSDTGFAPVTPAPGSGDEGAAADAGGARRPPDALPSPQDLYNAAYADFSKGNYALAISGFEEYAGRFPDSDLADNALYWVGECHFSQGDFARAIEVFDRLLGRFPGSDRAAAANLKKGLAYLEQNEIGKAIVQLRFVLEKYPSTDESRIARDKLASLGASVR